MLKSNLCDYIDVFVCKMRLIKRHIEADGSGSVTLLPEEPEDMVGGRVGPRTFCWLILFSGMRTI